MEGMVQTTNDKDREKEEGEINNESDYTETDEY